MEESAAFQIKGIREVKYASCLSMTLGLSNIQHGSSPIQMRSHHVDSLQSRAAIKQLFSLSNGRKSREMPFTIFRAQGDVFQFWDQQSQTQGYLIYCHRRQKPWTTLQKVDKPLIKIVSTNWH